MITYDEKSTIEKAANGMNNLLFSSTNRAMQIMDETSIEIVENTARYHHPFRISPISSNARLSVEERMKTIPSVESSILLICIAIQLSEKNVSEIYIPRPAERMKYIAYVMNMNIRLGRGPSASAKKTVEYADMANRYIKATA